MKEQPLPDELQVQRHAGEAVICTTLGANPETIHLYRELECR
jgi:hypothetical protein